MTARSLVVHESSHAGVGGGRRDRCQASGTLGPDCPGKASPPGAAAAGSAGLFKGVTYKPVCGPSGCVNIVKRCQDNLKNCGLYWNTEATGIYKKATDASLEYRLDVVGRTVYGPRWYGHTKNANEKPFFHGSWGFSNGNSWGKYEYGCWLVATCTGYMKSTDGVTFDGDGYWHRDGLKYHTIYGSWGTGKGKVVAWQGNLKWAGLPS